MKSTTGKLLWAGFSHFVVGLFVVDLALAFLLAAVGALFELRWLMIAIAGATVAVPPFMAIRAVLKERARQRQLGLSGVPEVIRDPVLGELRRAELDPEMWETKVTANGSAFPTVIDGEGMPDATLLEDAREVARNATEFLRSVSESKELLIPSDPFFTQHADEIRALTVEAVMFYHAAKPDDAEVYFSGGIDGRCWRGNLAGFRVDALGCET